MKELEALLQLHSDHAGTIIWPQEQEKQEELARAIYGKGLISTLDYWVSYMLDLLYGTDKTHEYSPHTLTYQLYMPIREGLSRLDPLQQHVVATVIRHLASSILFASQVSLDQAVPGYATTVILAPITESDRSTSRPEIRLKMTRDDLHDYVGEWVWNFSKYADVLVERTEDQYGTSYRLI